MRGTSMEKQSTALCFAVLTAFSLTVHAQTPVVAPAQTFVQNCGFCHGSDARGGAEGGSDLRVSPIVSGDPTGARLRAFLKTGRPEQKMPAFDLPEAQLADITAFLRGVVAAAPPAGGGRGGIVAEVTGDPKAGEDYFNGAGKCNTCHSVNSDLKGAGSRMSASTLQGRLVMPRGNGGYPSSPMIPLPGAKPDVPKTVTVTPVSGSAVSGTLLSISDFYVTLRDAAGVRHTFARDCDVPEVVVTDPLQGHIDLVPKLTDRDMHNLTAYLVTLK